MEKYAEYAGNRPTNVEDDFGRGCLAYCGRYPPQEGDGIASISE